jgi:hypothetical protein
VTEIPLDSARSESKFYFVDEAGDPTIFDSRGKVLIGNNGCSRFFALGLADIPDARKLSDDLGALRQRLLADPFFKGVPSMQAEGKKTALLFHAKDDLVEVRREVFALIQKHDIRFSAVVKDKVEVLEYVQRRNRTHPDYRYDPNELYDFIVRRLFRERLHKHGHYRVCIARRGNSDRTRALTYALEEARADFVRNRGADIIGRIEVVSSSPIREPALQAVDYFLWALQRTFERHEDRFLQYLWPQCSLVVDADDKRANEYGAYYTKRKPLTAAALKEAEGYRTKPPK